MLRTSCPEEYLCSQMAQHAEYGARTAASCRMRTALRHACTPSWLYKQC